MYTGIITVFAFNNAELSNVSLDEATSSNVSLINATLKNARFYGNDFIDAQLTSSNLTYATIIEANLKSATLISAEIIIIGDSSNGFPQGQHVKITVASLRGTIQNGKLLNTCRIHGGMMTCDKLIGGILTNQQTCNWIRPNIPSHNFSTAELSQGNLDGCGTTNSVLNGVSIPRCNLDLNGNIIQLTGGKLDGNKLTGGKII